MTQGRELAKRADEMSTRNLRDRRPLQTASKVLTSDLENFNNRVEHVKRWLEDAVNFHNLLKKVKLLECPLYAWFLVREVLRGTVLKSCDGRKVEFAALVGLDFHLMNSQISPYI